MEYDPVNKNGKVKVKDMSTNEEKTVSFSQHLSEAFDVGDWQETIVLRESINYDGITIVSFNTSAPHENTRKRKTPPQSSLLIPPKGGEITPEKRVKNAREGDEEDVFNSPRFTKNAREGDEEDVCNSPRFTKNAREDDEEYVHLIVLDLRKMQ